MRVWCKRHYCGFYSMTAGSHWLAGSGGWYQLGRVHLFPGSVLGSGAPSQAELSLHTQRKVSPEERCS